MKYPFFALLLLLPAIANADIYKWVDAKGVTHYSRTPNNQNHEKLDIKENKQKSIPDGAQEAADQLISKGYGDSKDVDCDKAVSNALSGLNTMIEVGEKNYRDGYLEKTAHDKTIGKLKEIQSEISISRCKSAKDNELEFYKCMSNDSNHVAHCGQKHMSK